MSTPDIKFVCPHCNQTLEAPSEMAGTTIECPGCDKPITVPTPAKATVNQSVKLKPSLTSAPIPNPPSPNKTATPRNMTGIVIGAVSVVVITVGAILFLYSKKANVSTVESAKLENKSDSLPTLNDDQTYDYIKVKLGESQSPAQQVELLKSYIAKFPSGKHIGEAMALIEITQTKASVSSVSLDCSVVTKSGQSIPVIGWIQIIKTEETAEQVWKNIKDNEKLKQTMQEKEKMDPVYAAAAEYSDAAKSGSEGTARAVFLCMIDLFREPSLKAKAVSTLELTRGQASFSNLPPGDYFIYGAGHAGQNVVFYFSEYKAEPGKSSAVSPKPLFAFFASSDEEYLCATKLPTLVSRFNP